MKIERTWNPLTFKDDNIVVEVEVGLTPNEIIRQAGFDFQRPFYLTINGEPMGRDEWDTYQVQETDVCHFVELPGVATIGTWLANMILMSMAEAGVTMSYALVWGVTYASYAVAATAVIGGLSLVNRFIGQSPQTPSSIGQNDEIYSVTSGSNRKRINSPYAEQFGRLKIYPDLASAPYVEYPNAINTLQFADKPEGYQYMYFLGIIGIGEYDISKVQIAETDVNDMPGVEYSIIQPGNTDDIPYHPSVVYTVDTFNGQTINQANTTDYQPQQCVINPPGNNSSIAYIAFDLSFPNGIYHITKKGNKKESGVFIQARVRKIHEITGEPIGDWKNPLWVNNAGPWERYQPEIQGLFIGGVIERAARITLEAPVPDGIGRYEIKIGCIDVDPYVTEHINDCQLGQIRGFGGYHTHDWVGSDFSDCTLIAMKIRADVNLTGAIADKINVICTRKLYPVTATGFGTSKVATRSIVDAVAYMVTSDNGGKQDESLLDFESLYDLRTKLETASWYFDYRFQSRMSVMEACALAAKCGRAVPYLPGKFVLIQDTEQSTPSGKFTSEDYTEGTFGLSHNFKTADSPTGIQIKCVDANTWEEIDVDCYDDDGSDQNLAVVPLDGCTSRQQAYDIGMYMYLDDKYNRSDVEFTTGLQGHIPLPGSRIMIDIPAADGWQRSGLIHSISGSTIHLSEPIEWNGETSGVIYLTGTGAALTGPYTVTPGTEDYIVSGILPAGTKTVVTDAGDAARYLFAFSSDETVSMRVTRIEPSGTNNIKISGTIYGNLPYVSPGTVGTVPIVIPRKLLDTVSLFYKGPSPDNLYYNYAMGWTGYATAVKIEIDQGSGFAVAEEFYSSTTYNFQISSATTIQIKVTAYEDGALNPLHSITKSYTAPGTVTNLALLGKIGKEYTLTWDAVLNATEYKISVFVDTQEKGSFYSNTNTYLVTYEDSLLIGGPYAEFTVHVAALINADIGKYASLDLLYENIAPNYLIAIGQPYAILLQFLYEKTDSLEAVEILMSTTTDFADAVLIGETLSNEWRIAGLDIGDVRYFWIRCRYTGGIYSDFYPESTGAGVMGTASTDPADYLQVLNGNISEDQLVNDLLTRIDKIDKDYIYEHGVFLSTTPFDMVFSGIDKIIDGTFSDVEQHKIDITNLVVSSNKAANDIAVLEFEISALTTTVEQHKIDITNLVVSSNKAANDIAVLESEISALTTTPWSNSASYAVGNYVLHNSKVWRCIKAYTPPPAQEPGLALDYWEESNSLATVVATIDTRVDELEGEIVTKAATITVDQLINRVTAAESSILQNASDILLRVEQTEFDAFSQLFLPEFSTTEFYAVNDYVKYNNTAYRCIKTIDFSPAPLPTNTEYWEISPFADKFSSIINQVELNEEGISLTSSAIIGSVTYLIDTTANRSYETGVFVESISDVQDIDVRITQAGIDIDGAKSQINLLATQISGLDGRVSQAEVDIDGAQANILLKASQVEVDSLSNRMSTAELDIDGAEAAIALKASQTEVDSLSNRMSTAESDIVLNKDNISLTSSSITGPITFLTDTESRSYETGVFIESISDIKDVDIRITQAGIDIDGAEAKINLLTSYVDGLSGHLSQAEIDIDAAQADILLKASQVEVDGLSSRVSQAEIDIDAGQADILLKASQVEVDGLSSRVSQAEIDIDAAQADILLKASQIEVDGLSSRVSQAEIDIDAGQAGSWASISSRVMTATYEEDQKDSDGYLRIAAAENRLAVYDTSNAPVWNATTTYYPGSIVLLTGTYYRCILQSYNNQPPNATYWTPISAGLLSQWTVKLNANGRVAGVGLMLDDSGSSEFIVLSDKFQVVNPTDTMTPKAVFTVGNINGVSAVGVAGDMIIDGAILARHIATNQLTVGDNVAMGPDAYISWSNVTGRPNTTYIDANGIYTGTIDASQINAGTISSDRIDAESISASKLSFSSLSGLNADEGSKLAGIAEGADVTLSAINGGLTVTGGGITLSSGGAIKGGQTDYATETGWFLGYSDGYKLSIGNPSAAHLHWNGSELEVSRMAVTRPDVVATGYCGCSIAQFGTAYINTGFKELVDHWSTISNNSYVARAIVTSGYINTSHDIARWFLTTTLAQIVGLGPGASGVVWQGQTWYQYEIGIQIDVQSINFLVGDSISEINWALMKV
jgi:hypothetical protein